MERINPVPTDERKESSIWTSIIAFACLSLFPALYFIGKALIILLS